MVWGLIGGDDGKCGERERERGWDGIHYNREATEGRIIKSGRMCGRDRERKKEERKET